MAPRLQEQTAYMTVFIFLVPDTENPQKEAGRLPF